jgi:hypothetical protein
VGAAVDEIGFVAFLPKPIKPSRLVDTLVTIFDGQPAFAKVRETREISGVSFVPLQALQSPDQVLSTVIEALNLQTSRDPRTDLLNWLEEKRLLLIM